MKYFVQKSWVLGRSEDSMKTSFAGFQGGICFSLMFSCRFLHRAVSSVPLRPSYYSRDIPAVLAISQDLAFQVKTWETSPRSAALA